MAGERRLTSIKQLVNDMLLHADLTGTITIDEITNTVTVQLVEPVTVDGTLAISSIGGTVATSTTITNVPLATKEQLTPITLTSTLVSVANVDTLVLAANPNRKYLLIQRGTTVGRVFVHFDSTPATVTSGMLFRENTYYTMPALPNQAIYTGEIRAITIGSNKILYITEGF